MQEMRHLVVEGAFNVRDLGGYDARGGVIPWRRFLRADSLHRIAEDAAQQLYDEGLRCVIDLRTAKEVAAAPSPFEHFPGVQYRNLPLFDDLAPANLSQAHSDDGHPLFDFYRAALETRGPAICAILSAIARAGEGAVLFNCTAGKDRTGIVALLLLAIAEVPREVIVQDYTLTAERIPELVDEFLSIARAEGGDAESYARLLESPAETLSAILDLLDAQYGGIEGFLDWIGLTRDDLDKLRVRLRGAAP